MRLAAGDWALEAAPERGGAILSLTRAGRDILRPATPGAGDPFDPACFPLIPYANRIGFGTFDWEGRTYRLPRNHAVQVHPLHGVGWLRPWAVTGTGPAAIVMRLDHPGDRSWPWPFRAEQRLTLSPAGLAAELDIRNTARRAMPLSLGFHPYFAAAHTLAFDASGVWLTDDAMLPTTRAAADALGDWKRPASVSRSDLVDIIAMPAGQASRRSGVPTVISCCGRGERPHCTSICRRVSRSSARSR